MDGGEDALDVRVGQVRQRASRRPSRRCSGRCRRRAVACGRARRAARSLASPSQIGDDARLGPVQPLLDDDPSRRIARVEVVEQRRLGVGARVSSTVTPLPAARPSSLTTTPAPAAAIARHGTVRLRPGRADRRASHPDAGRGRDLVAERLGPFDPRRRPASGRRPRSRPR